MGTMMSWVTALVAFIRPKAPAPKALPPVVIRHLHQHYDGFFAPNPTIYVQCCLADGKTVVGDIRYGVSPLNDRIYVPQLEIKAQYQRQGYGTSVLLALAHQHAVEGRLLPITPMHEIWSGVPFWRALRQGHKGGLTVTTDLHPSQQDEESARWAHLKPPARNWRSGDSLASEVPVARQVTGK